MYTKKQIFKDKTSIIVNKLRKNKFLNKEELKYYKKFNTEYWEGLI